MREKRNKFLVIPNDKKLNEYESNSFILPLKNFSVGFDTYFSFNEIEKYSTIYEVSIILNKFIHKEDLFVLKNELLKLKNIKYFFVEDFSLQSILPFTKIVLFPNHIISNYESVNYLKELGLTNVVISNELTIDELKYIKDKTNSDLFYFYLNKNSIMYSKRELLTNYYDNYSIKNGEKSLIMKEEISHHELKIVEENKSTVIFNNKIFCASKYLKELKYYNLIINFSNLNDFEKKLILKNINNEELYKLIDSDFYFLENEIMYKVGDLK